MVIELRPIATAPIPNLKVQPIDPIETSFASVTKGAPQSFVPSLATEYYYGTSGDDYYNYVGPSTLQADGNYGNDFIWGNYGNDTISGNYGNDTLRGYYGNDTLAGGFGDDKLYGEHGNDILFGEEGNDYLDGGFGNDNLYGMTGNDRLNGYGNTVNNDSQFDNLYGGKGADTFVLGGSAGVYYDETGDGYAVIKDFNYREGDKIEVKGNASQYQLEYKSVGGIGTAAMDTEIYYLHTDGSRDRIGIVEDKAGSEVLKNLDFNYV
jgi:RTX calcium-binding nonapeptide repeat (4 copies)